MKQNIDGSETMHPITDEIIDDTDYSAPTLIRSTASASIYQMRSGGKTVCIKVPSSDSGLHLDMLKREFKIGSALSHPCIVSYLKWEASSPVGPGILLEYVDGTSLNEFLAKNPPLNVRRRIFGQILDAVDYLHHCGVVHNDIKPSNIMVSRVSRSVKLIDFGFADNDTHTLQRVMGGTIGYASPELVKGDTNADARADIYSLGALMHDIFGCRYNRVARRCLNPDADRRYHSVAQLRKAWENSIKAPRRILTILLLILLIGVIAWSVAARRSSMLASERAHAIKTHLNDSISTLNAKVTTLDSNIVDMERREYERLSRIERIETLKSHYEAGADSLAKAIGRELRKSEDVSGLLTILGAFNDRFNLYSKEFAARYGEDAAEVVETHSIRLSNKTYESIYSTYQGIYERMKSENK